MTTPRRRSREQQVALERGQESLRQVLPYAALLEEWIQPHASQYVFIRRLFDRSPYDPYIRPRLDEPMPGKTLAQRAAITRQRIKQVFVDLADLEGVSRSPWTDPPREGDVEQNPDWFDLRMRAEAIGEEVEARLKMVFAGEFFGYKGIPFSVMLPFGLDSEVLGRWIATMKREGTEKRLVEAREIRCAILAMLPKADVLEKVMPEYVEALHKLRNGCPVHKLARWRSKAKGLLHADGKLAALRRQTKKRHALERARRLQDELMTWYLKSQAEDEEALREKILDLCSKLVGKRVPPGWEERAKALLLLTTLT